MEEQPANTEEKIILAAIDCIEQYGLTGATNRRIAQAAGVNLASINYYFRSKEALIQRVKEISLKNAFALRGLPPMPGANPAKRCIAVFMHLLEGNFRYPGLARAHFHSLLAEGHGDALLVGYLNRFVDELAADLQARGVSLPPPELKMALMQMVSAIITASLAPTLFAQQGLDLHRRMTALAYVTRLVEKLL